MKGTIIALVGPSGCGKTTLSMHIQKTMGFPAIVSYTTRERRPEELNGREHWFVSEADMPAKNTMLAYAFFGGKHYWTSVDQVPSKCPCTYTIDEKALLEMIDRYGADYRFIKVYIKRKNIDVDAERQKRDEGRTLLGDAYYDVVIENNGSLEEFLKKGSKTISGLL